MILLSETFKTLEAGLAQGFHNEDSLDELLFAMDEVPGDVKGSGDLTSTLRRRIITYFSERNGLDRLVRQAIALRPGNEQFWEAGRRILPIPERYLAELQHFLRALPKALAVHAAEAFAASTPPWGETLERSAGSAPSAGDYAHHLATKFGKDEENVYPLFRFAQLLTSRLETVPAAAELVEKLNRWLDTSTAEAFPDAAVRQKSRQAAARRRPAVASRDAGDPYLLIEVSPVSTGRGRAVHYRLRAWLRGTAHDRSIEPRQGRSSRSPRAGAPSPRESAERHYDAGELRLQIRKRVEELGGVPVNQRSVRVELMLPRVLLGAAVDQWEIDFGALGGPLGFFHPVVVRPFRGPHSSAAPPHYMQALDAVGARCLVVSKLPPRPDTEHPLAALAVCARKLTADQLWADLGRDENAAVVCCVLDTPPVPERRRDALAALMDARVPVVLWLRGTVSANARERAAKRVIELVDGEVLDGLPKRVLYERQQARPVARKSHVGRHLTLFWDDPRRRPPEESAAPFRLEIAPESPP